MTLSIARGSHACNSQKKGRVRNARAPDPGQKALAYLSTSSSASVAVNSEPEKLPFTRTMEPALNWS